MEVTLEHVGMMLVAVLILAVAGLFASGRINVWEQGASNAVCATPFTIENAQLVNGQLVVTLRDPQGGVSPLDLSTADVFISNPGTTMTITVSAATVSASSSTITPGQSATLTVTNTSAFGLATGQTITVTVALANNCQQSKTITL